MTVHHIGVGPWLRRRRSRDDDDADSGLHKRPSDPTQRSRRRRRRRPRPRSGAGERRSRLINRTTCKNVRGLPYMTSAKFSDLWTPYPHLSLSSAFWGPPFPHPLRTSYMEAPLRDARGTGRIFFVWSSRDGGMEGQNWSRRKSNWFRCKIKYYDDHFIRCISEFAMLWIRRVCKFLICKDTTNFANTLETGYKKPFCSREKWS